MEEAISMTRNPAYVYTIFIVMLFTVIIFTPLSVGAADYKFRDDSPIELDADSITHDKDKGFYLAEGNVVIRQGPIVIKADSVSFNMESGALMAEGGIDGNDEGGNLFKGDRLDFNMNTKTGIIVNGSLFFKEENVYIDGERIEKTGEESYKIDRGIFTTCDCEEGDTPAWSMYTGQADVSFGGFLDAWHNIFYVKGVPVLYSPYLTAPVKRKRQTGFLTPGFGYSSLGGTELQTSFFWAISENTDATLYLDIATERGVGKGLEYRYIRESGSEGQLYLYHFKERDIKKVRSFRAGSDNLSRPQTAEDGRWYLHYIHREAVPFGMVFKTNMRFVSDDEYFIDFGTGKDRSLESLESTASLSKGWGRYNLVVEARLFDNLLAEDDNSTLQMLPVATFTAANKSILGSPLYFSLGSTFVNFEREVGVEGQRLDIHPRLSVPLNPGGYFDLTPSIAPRGTFYWTKRHEEGRFQDREIYEGAIDLTTSFIRVFSLGKAGAPLTKLRHTVRPKITYTYVPDVKQEYLPSYDQVDRIYRKNEISYSLVSILTGRFGEVGRRSYRDYLYLDIRQSYSIDEATRKLISTGDNRRPFSDIMTELRATPGDWLNISIKGEYDPYEGWIENYYASLGLSDRRGDRLDLSYRYIREDNEYLDSELIIGLFRPVQFRYKNRYSYNTNKSIETIYGVEYRHQCWNALLSYTSRIEEDVIMVTLSLLGMGNVGSFSPTFDRK